MTNHCSLSNILIINTSFNVNKTVEKIQFAATSLKNIVCDTDLIIRSSYIKHPLNMKTDN